MKSITIALVFGVLCLSQPTIAQEVGVREVYFDTLRTGDVQPTPIGVEAMIYDGTDYITSRDSTLMDYATRILRRDLDFYADFELIEVDSFFIKLYEIAELDLFGWQRLGAQYVVKLETAFPGKMMRVRWKLRDANTKRQFASGVVDRPKDEWRQLGHEIANEIVTTLTGDPGIFLTNLVYVKQNGKAKELFVSDYDGANERQLTNNGSLNLSPVFTPTGDAVYFCSYQDGDPHLYKVSLTGGKTTKVAAFPGLVAAPAISPDGNKIACTLTKDGNSEIYVLDLQGNVIKRLTRHWSIDTSPTWSPDGRMIAFSSDRSGAPQVYTMDADGLNVRRLTFQTGYNDSPIWSERGNRITFVSRTKGGRFDLASIDTSGVGYRLLTQRGHGHNENPHFSPDGKHIVFSSTRLGPLEIFTMDVTGRNQRRLTRHNGCSNPVWGPLTN
jgi:TolB protein